LVENIDGYEGKGLFLYGDLSTTKQSIAQFSQKDADSYEKYETFLKGCRDIISPMLDGPPPFLDANSLSSFISDFKLFFLVIF